MLLREAARRRMIARQAATIPIVSMRRRAENKGNLPCLPHGGKGQDISVLLTTANNRQRIQR